jgi:soluble lytic murein transglycosylase-like protein
MIPPPAVALRAHDGLDDEADRVPMLAAALGDCANRLSRKQRWSLARIIDEESDQHGWDPLFITALVQVESGCKPTAVGGGAIGLTQMLPTTAREVARRVGYPWRGPTTLTEPAASVELGLHYLRELEEMFDDPYKAVAAYNMGPRPVMRMSSQRAQRTRYVRKVLSRYEQLLDQYA